MRTLRPLSLHLSRFWYGLLALSGTVIAAQLVLLWLASSRSESALQHVCIVNLCSFCGLLALFARECVRRSACSRAHNPADLSRALSVQRPVRAFQEPKSVLYSGSAALPQQNDPFAAAMPPDFHHIQRAVETMQLGVTITDMRGAILYTNPAEAAMHGYRVDELLGQDLGMLAPAELRNPMTREEIGRIRHERESINIKKDGSRFPVRLLSDVLRDQQGTPVAVVTTCEDLTDQKRLTNAMKQRTRELAILNRLSEQLHACHAEAETYQLLKTACRKLFPRESGCLCIMDAVEPHLKVVEYWGLPPECAEGPPRADSAAATLCPYQNVCSDHDCLCVPISASGEILGLLSLCYQPEPEKIGGPDEWPQRSSTMKQALLHRVAEQYALSLINLRLRESLRMEAIRDPLTGLFNRRYMEESLAREARRARRHNTPIGVIMLDIDHFKLLNDAYGHEAGDAVLQEVGNFLQCHTRGEDIACRYGGEEFLVILPEAPLDIVSQRAHDLHAGIRELKLLYHDRPLSITVSLGLASLPEHSADVRQVVRAADLAMYQAKRGGRDQVAMADAAPQIFDDESA